MKNIIIWGAKGQGLMAKEVAEELDLNVLGFFDNNRNIKSPFEDIPIFYDIEKLKIFENPYFTVAIGYDHNIDRYKISKKLSDLGFKSIKLVSTNAYVSPSSSIMDGVQIFANSVIMPKVYIDEYSSISPSVTISHECIIGKGVFMGAGITLCGEIEIGDFTVIGAGATILPRIKIGKNVVIGAGSLVTKNVEDNKIVYGNPARLKL